jgi:O-antigen/teichoic acid export membrane protein
VGIATALISSLLLIVAFSRFGFDTALIRFLPTQDHSRVFNTCLWITIGATIIVTLFYLLAIDVIAPEIAFIREFALIFLILAIVSSVIDTTGYALLCLRKGNIKLLLNLLTGLRLPLLIPFVFLGSLGIFFSLGLANLVAAIIAVVLIRRFVPLALRIDRAFVRTTFQFSSMNYLANLLNSLPALVMPILIVNLLSPENAALYYIAFAIGSLVLIVPEAMSTSFFIEGSHGINLRKGTVMTLSVTYAALVPAVLFIVLFGDLLLNFFGSEYTTAFNLLRLIAISSFFVTIFNLFIPLQNIRMQVRGVVAVNFLRFAIYLGLSYILLQSIGVIGAGIAWLITHMILSVGIVAYVKVKGWI